MGSMSSRCRYDVVQGAAERQPTSSRRAPAHEKHRFNIYDSIFHTSAAYMFGLKLSTGLMWIGCVEGSRAPAHAQ